MSRLHPHQLEPLLNEIRAASSTILKDVANCERDGRFAQKAFEELRSRGLFSICASKVDGGADLVSLRDLTETVRLLAKIDASVATAVQMHLVLSWYFARTARIAPDSPQKRLHSKWIREIGHGKMIASSTVSEPGQDARSPRTVATKTMNGWNITGVKSIASNAPGATHFYTRVRFDAPDGPKLASVMIPFDRSTVTINDDWDGLGLRVSGSCSVSFENAFAPKDALTIGGDWGPSNLEASYEGRLASVAPLLGVTVGIIEGAHEDCMAAFASRKSKPLSSAEIHLLSEIELQRMMSGAIIDVILTRLDAAFHDLPPGLLPNIDSQELLGELVSAGILVERAATAVCDMAMQFCGGRSYQSKHPVARRFRDARALFFMRPFAPANEWRDYLAERSLQARHGGYWDNAP